MPTPDPIMDRLTEAIALHHGGQHEAARGRFAELWEAIGPAGDPFHRCTLAHFMADEQEDPQEALVWDLRALEAADSLTDERVKGHHASMDLESFYPSLHLNVAEGYRRVGDRDRARAHVLLARERAAVLPEHGYGRMIRGGIARLAEQLGIPPA